MSNTKDRLKMLETKVEALTNDVLVLANPKPEHEETYLPKIVPRDIKEHGLSYMHVSQFEYDDFILKLDIREQDSCFLHEQYFAPGWSREEIAKHLRIFADKMNPPTTLATPVAHTGEGDKCIHPLSCRRPYHDSSIVCNQCNCVIEQYGEKLDHPCDLSPVAHTGEGDYYVCDECKVVGYLTHLSDDTVMCHRCGNHRLSPENPPQSESEGLTEREQSIVIFVRKSLAEGVFHNFASIAENAPPQPASDQVTMLEAEIEVLRRRMTILYHSVSNHRKSVLSAEDYIEITSWFYTGGTAKRCVK